MGCIGAIGMFFVVDVIFSALFGSTVGLVVAILCGIVIPALVLVAAVIHDRELEREMAKLRWPPSQPPGGGHRG